MNVNIPSLFKDQKWVDRFYDKILQLGDDECWPWVGYINAGQARYYRRIPVQGSPRGKCISISPARIAYILHRRKQVATYDLPWSYDIARHKFCAMTRECMNPNHMFTRLNGKMRGGERTLANGGSVVSLGHRSLASDLEERPFDDD